MRNVIATVEIFRKLQRRLIMFGEIHGTNEVPELVSVVVHELAKKGARILVALEIPDLLNGGISDFVAGKTKVDEFLAGKLFWNRDNDMQDGRSSRAMLRLIQDIREYRNRGLLIDPQGFDSVVLSTTDRDRMMALNLHELVRNAPYDHVIILAGNYHARRTSPFLGVGRRPMASYFDRGELLTVQVRFLGGSAWNCRRRNPCGVFELPAVSYAHPLNRVHLLPPDARNAKRFDAEVVLARSTPSPPACRHRSSPT